ncbi:MAG: two-component system, OmpR family, sensor kinase [Chloroflexota bacterium]|nr:two-component system, OmpR family, sensor kinase [Chloroflexota bacterium]
MAADKQRPGAGRRQAPDWVIWLIALVGPGLLTVCLLGITGLEKRNYVFLYLGLIAAVGVARGLWPALLAAVLSFAFLDYFFVQPYYTFTISNSQDLLNLVVFIVTAALVGILASRRRRALLDSEALARQLRDVNAELVRLNKEQAEASQAALRLARSEQQIRVLQETDRLRRELLANVSHELRTPLGTILAESTDQSAPPTVAEAERRLATVGAEARRLEALVHDMLDMARIEGGALDLDLEPLRLADALAAATERLHHASHDRAVDWDQPAAQVDVLADWARLGQVLDNLLANADRFAPAGTPITVKVSSETSGLVTIRVADRGPGVATELRERIFERFVRGDANDQATSSGTGLGLAIVKGLVEAHAGSVALEESPHGAGAVFRFTLPLAPEQTR